MGQCFGCDESISAKAETKDKHKPVQKDPQEKNEKTVVKTDVSPSAEKIGKSSSQLKKQNTHYIKSAVSVDYHGRKHGKVPKSRCSIASTSSTERIAKRKLAHGMTPRVTIDMKKIMENLREKQTMRKDVALIGHGGRNKSATFKSSTSPTRLKSAQSGRRREGSWGKSNNSQSCTRSVSNRSANSSRQADQKSKEKQNPKSNRKASPGFVEDEV